jgi:pimeloyl-ACP methyl ester carboxylesterase
MRACINEFVNRRIPVIPVLLPGAAAKPELPIFLRRFTWVDLRYGLSEEGIDLLQWGITGEKPPLRAKASNDTQPEIHKTATTEVDEPVQEIIKLRSENLEIVRFSVVFSGIVDDKNRALVDGLLAQLRDIAQDSRLTLIKIEKGSTRLTLESSLDGFERIYHLYRSGQLQLIRGEKIEKIRRKKLVILIHGIRTRAEWQTKVRKMLKDTDVTVVSIMYGYFDLIKFLFPFWTREIAIDQIKRKIRMELHDHPSGNPEITVMAHSFGTYAIVRILREEPDLRIDRLLLCGSIIPSTFKWETLPNCPHQVLNEVGTKDMWPILAKAATWGYGTTGTFGFGAPRVRDRFHNLGHSDFFVSEFVEKYWKPWIRDDLVVNSKFEGERPATSWLTSIAEFVPLRWGISAGMVVGIWELMRFGRAIVESW